MLAPLQEYPFHEEFDVLAILLVGDGTILDLLYSEFGKPPSYRKNLTTSLLDIIWTWYSGGALLTGATSNSRPKSWFDTVNVLPQ